jgi:hypothetical protein
VTDTSTAPRGPLDDYRNVSVIGAGVIGASLPHLPARRWPRWPSVLPETPRPGPREPLARPRFPRLDQPTVELLGEQARGDESVAVLAAERDQAQIKLMQALGQTPPDDLAPATR